MQRVSLRYELSAFPAIVRALDADPLLGTYYDGRPLPALVEQVARRLLALSPGMTQATRASIFRTLSAGTWFEPPGILFTLWEACSGGVRESRAYWYNVRRKAGKVRRPRYHVK